MALSVDETTPDVQPPQDRPPQSVDEGPPWICPECLEPFDTKFRRGTHMWTAHKIRSSSKPAGPRKRKAPRSDRAPRATSKALPSLTPQIEVILRVLFTGWKMRDQHEDGSSCGDVAVGQSRELAKQINAMAKDNPVLHRWISGIGQAGGWGGFVLASWPIVESVRDHHIVPAIRRRREEAASEELPDWGPEVPAPVGA